MQHSLRVKSITEILTLDFIPLSKHKFCTESTTDCRSFQLSTIQNRWYTNIFTNQGGLGIKNGITFCHYSILYRARVV